ncbi:MAG: TonB-dependent receptor [Lewinellaceae bacterium]|nr:TonB-dependent receptor [Saprospiraceae bacterium]MCB9330956.1 TonB-dependent receptor [Lewinellaceae bacterium]
MNEVVISGYKEEKPAFSPLNIIEIKLDSLKASSQFNLCDILKQTEGVSVLSTGNGIAKPVIRGLYGNRVLVLLNGLRFDNQQWQEEHGLGLTSFGLSKVELIKGPIGILYGAEAIGGVINLIEEQKPLPESRQLDIGLNVNSNTLGGMLQAGYKKSHKNKWWSIRIGVDNNADYSDGKSQRVLNSRFDGYYLKSTFGFEKKNWVSTNNFSASFNRFGFIFNDIYNFVFPDNRWSRALDENPAHLVLLNVLSSENKFRINEKVKLNVNIGVQSNRRMENEGGGAISLNMHLLTIQSLAKLEYRLNEKNKLIFSNLNAFEDNTNYGARKIVPDASMQESNLSVNHEHTINNKWTIENGFGVGEKWIKTFFTPSVNGPEQEVRPFEKFSPYYNFLSGLSYYPSKQINLKANIATGVRIGNLAELSSNGLHEGIFTYEIGNPDLKNEQIFSFNFLAAWNTNVIEIWCSPFFNYFKNYIYLTPVQESWFGFPVYQYKQQDAHQYGSECSATLKPYKNVQLKLGYSGMISKTADGSFTPFLPAQKIESKITWQTYIHEKTGIRVFTNLEHYSAQNNTAPNETSTPEYSIWNAGVSLNLKTGKNEIEGFLNIHNLLNTAYYDHLSRFKNLGLLNMGRNFSLGIKLLFN